MNGSETYNKPSSNISAITGPRKEKISLTVSEEPSFFTGSATQDERKKNPIITKIYPPITYICFHFDILDPRCFKDMVSSVLPDVNNDCAQCLLCYKQPFNQVGHTVWSILS